MILYLILPFLFIIWPFGAIVASYILLFNMSLTQKQVTLCLFVISCFWGILAFSQKSLSDVDTDCIRYYTAMQYYEGWNPLIAVSSINLLELLNFIFSPITIFIIALTNNVQSMSFFWTALVYFLTFLSLRKLIIYYECFTQKKFAILVLVITFCFMSFVQISELLKNSASFAVFFYGFTLYFTSENKFAGIVCSILAIGIHPSAIMLLPMFIYRRFNVNHMFIIVCIFFVLSIGTNVINLLMDLLPSGKYFDLLMDRFGDYSNDQVGTMHYVIIQLIMLGSALYLLCFSRNYKKDNAIKIVLFYFLISTLNFYNLTAYLRFTIFSHWIFSLIIVNYLKYVEFGNCKYVIRGVVILMLILNLRWTYGRTMIEGGYCSSYMDNEIKEIMFSSSFNYLQVDYEK